MPLPPRKRKSFCSPAVKQKLAEAMRRQPTPEEDRLWQALREEQAQTGLRFTRQRVIRGWIADLYCAAARVVVEVDGPVHLLRRSSDRFRDRTLAVRENILTLRFTNDQVNRQLPWVMAEIRKAVYPRCGKVQAPPHRKIHCRS